MYAKSIEKRELILDGAKNVILRKGFSATSMKDIIEECDISRGGLYFYFSSVEEIFVEILKTRKRTTEKLIQSFIDESANFTQLLDMYFDYQTERLLHIEKSLLSALIEFGLYHKEPADISLIEDQYQDTRDILLQIMDFGAQKGELRGEREPSAEQVLYLIEGMSIKAMTSGIQEEAIAGQFSLLKRQLVLGEVE